jgi:ferritin
MENVGVSITLVGFAITVIVTYVSLARKNLDDAKKLRDKANETLVHCTKFVEHETNNALLYPLFKEGKITSSQKSENLLELSKLSYEDFRKTREKVLKDFKINEEDLERIRFLADLSTDLKKLPDLMSEYVSRISNAIANSVKLVFLILLVSVALPFFDISSLRSLPSEFIILLMLILSALLMCLFQWGYDYYRYGLQTVRSNTMLESTLEKLKSSNDINEIRKGLDEVFMIVEE